MTRITVYEASDGNVVGIEARNHSGFDSEGSDIVCAAITTVFEVVSAGLSHLPREAVTDARAEDQTHWQIEINGSRLTNDQLNSINLLFHGSVNTLQNISEQYSEHCSLDTETVETF